jgi:fatty acid desaturase
VTYNRNWNSSENARRRLDAAYEQAQREWETWKEDIQELIFAPLAWAIATPIAFLLAIWLVRRLAAS